MYAISNGPTSIWAAGKTGWFEINPAPEYESMYETVCEGIDLYYSVLFAYEDAQKWAAKSKRATWQQLPIDDLLFQYAVKVGDGVTLLEAKDRCRKHASFLLAHFSKALDFQWNGTSFAKWMSSMNKDIVRKLVDVATKKVLEPSAKEPSSSPDAITKQELQDDTHQLPLHISPIESDRTRRSKSRASRQSQEADIKGQVATRWPSSTTRTETPIHPPLPARVPFAPTPPPPISPAESTTPSAIEQADKPSNEVPQDPVHQLKELVEEILADVGGDVRKVKHNTVHSKLYLKCSMLYPMASEVTHFYAKQLAASLPSKWYKSPFFLWLKEHRDKPWRPEHVTAENVASKLVRRKKSKHSGVPKARIPPVASSPSHAGKHYPGTPRISGLRPTTGVKRPIAYDDDGDDDDDEEGRPPKQSKTSNYHDTDENEDEEEDAVIDSSEEDESEIPSVSITSRPPPSIFKETMKIVVHTDKIPSMSPSGPNGTWKCEEDGCNYIVRSAEEADGRDLIAKHFKDHESRAEKVNLALTEGTRGHLPINHLLDKIRSFGESSQRDEEQSSSDGINFPRPIKRRLLI
ncbi:hypothetical protein M406DRAFT_349625 [Cryphonectria parasitica EP155]|uniref:Uncharacterized protein n=1 Tax=Cryphonectria parasitica (strain ATCC 38755 / EP155) TaxID=660469 RepID=A0A9P4YFD9_CRYP1|nr:uncharacterized protein M406DRAFT_349625 [Cryphonectria parasitica EP155]KAF3771270.1 hypothetical protein M406DRAFT_349625 [Cryphonectria parasitica EP155]